MRRISDARPYPARTTERGPQLLPGCCSRLAAALSFPVPADAASSTATVADALKKSPVYVDPRAESQLPKPDAEALAKNIKDAGKPVFVAVLPQSAEFASASVLKVVRSLAGITGLYAIRLGNGFSVGADQQVMAKTAVENLVGAVKRSSPPDAKRELNTFVD